jgi:hypothetical protein
MPRMANAAERLPLLDDLPALILMGRDEQHKPHAAWFADDQKEGAEGAAKLMGMKLISIGDDAGLREKASRLPRGKLFASGKAFVPFVNAGLYAELGGEPVPEGAKLRVVARSAGERRVSPAQARAARNLPTVTMSGSSGAASTGADAAGKAAFGAEKHYPTDWSKIRPGSNVLAQDTHDTGWFEAIVMNIAPGGLCTLRWRDYPTEPQIKRAISAIGLLPLPEDQTPAAAG